MEWLKSPVAMLIARKVFSAPTYTQSLTGDIAMPCNGGGKAVRIVMGPGWEGSMRITEA